jgi:diacylglycerol O-acyltransferase
MTTNDPTLAFMDQASFLWVRASGHVHGIQLTWVYRREIDLDRLCAVHDNLAHGLLGRRVEPTRVLGGRHRWVTDHSLPGIDVDAPRTRDGIAAWFSERAQLPIDPEHGPVWHLGVLPVTDYGTAVTLVASHTVVDGVGLCGAVTDAITGVRHDYGFPPPGARTRRQALAEDIRQMVRGLPQVGRALAAAVSVGVKNKPGGSKAAAPKPPKLTRAQRKQPVVVPTATIYIDLAQWDARAADLGGSSNALLAGFAARLGERYRRIDPVTHRVQLNYPVNDRGEDDLRANALKGMDFTVDPAGVTENLADVRATIKQALISGAGQFAEQEKVFPLTPFVPTKVVAKLPLGAVNAAGAPVGCSAFGDIDPVVARIDGADADYFTVRMVEQNLTAGSPEISSGELYMTAGRICDKLFISFRAYQPGLFTTKEQLLEQVSRVLDDFGLTAFIE